MTMHAPSEVALSNVIRAQLSLTRSLISSSRQMAESTLRSLNTNYRYTTLKETKEASVRVVLREHLVLGVGVLWELWCMDN